MSAPTLTIFRYNDDFVQWRDAITETVFYWRRDTDQVYIIDFTDGGILAGPPAFTVGRDNERDGMPDQFDIETAIEQYLAARRKHQSHG